ncbi:serine hydrolase domain-containing protein [Paenibacillus sp. EZ-K15]|uniref:serine hydrolase domain-containing protein n=1 Tax=Paenibacillus sp. EZ-K15 TaxID=2044275 RepID=UPI000BF26D56|nr:serine hydrolase domain-containing protein [Paenibacillus sp. EZ-K15]
MSNTQERIDTYLNSLAQDRKFSGSVLASKQDSILFKGGCGKANIELDVDNTPETVFRIGSITKTITALGVAQLIEQGKLSFDDYIGKYFPYQKDGDRITIHHLLTHTSGITNYTEKANLFDWASLPSNTEELLNRFSSIDLNYEPGEKYQYSNSGYALLGALIEQVSDQSYGSYIEDHIFNPLGMVNTRLDDPQEIIPLRASGYEIGTNEKLMNSYNIHPSNAYAAGGIISTVEDLYLWDQALYTNKLLPQHLINYMLTPHKGDHDYSYGCGWIIQDTPYGTMTGHTGGIPGFTSILMRFPSTKVTVIVLSNMFQDVVHVRQHIAGILHSNTAV